MTGPNVVPPRPDALAHNRPPGYPADAVRRHAEGTVVVVAHVSEDGIPAWVDIRTSSGDTSLDRSAQEAVALWRFQPAQRDGKTVAFDYELAIHFNLDDRPRRTR